MPICLLLAWASSQSFAAPANRPAPRRASKPVVVSVPAPETFGVGVMVGFPTGLTAKYWMQENTAVDFGVSYLLHDYFSFYIDQLWHFPGYFGSGFPELIPYIGAGGGVYTWSDKAGPRPWKDKRNTTAIYGRFPVGTEWIPSQSVGIFLEVAPGLAIVPGIEILLDLGLGIRFYF